MSEPYIGEIRIFAGNFAPNGWMMCSGQLMQIADYDTLFNLIGTTYGGDGQVTFGLPDLRGRVVTHLGGVGASYALGQIGGAEQVTLTSQQTPQHTHAVNISGAAGNTDTPTGSVLSAAGPAGTTLTPYAAAGSGTQITMSATEATMAGGSQPHDNMQPYVAINYIISMYGIYPTQS